MHINQSIKVQGCITQEKYVKARSAAELERILGFKAGRLRPGFVVAALEVVPATNQFELLGYTQVAEHKFNSDALKGLEVNKLKEIARSNFSHFGPNRLLKILPNTAHQIYISNDEQYPPGQGVPQWKLIVPVDATVVKIIRPGEMYY